MSTPSSPDQPAAPRNDGGALPHLSRRAWIWSIAGLAALIAAVSAYAVVAAQAQKVLFQDVGYSVVDEHLTTATFDVFLYADGVATCTVRALNEAYAEVGVVTVDVDSADGAEQRMDTSIATTEKAVTASVLGCTFVAADAG
ncbi:DUF4307 domain-containing protein [Demequina capsici]|uniref:DUF4307 domain-containing protein n=1 Tax=Demequina capsici TaxID=3075620 RepID=A0AA96FCU4_9MICO|nr:DUF4307 domain-containing protein [Demequina sp. PMTSA13]WNM27969.1 DUF4307 domain-containing protein [Demequina sp. PMTSA13]